MKRYFFSILTLFLALSAALQAQEHKLEIVAPQGATVFKVKFATKDKADVHLYKDGQIAQTFTGMSHLYAKQIEITFENPLQADSVLTFDGSSILMLEDDYWDKIGEIPVGFGTIDCPELTSFYFNRSDMDRSTNGGLLDFSKCPKVEMISAYNVKKIALPEETSALKNLTLSLPYNRPKVQLEMESLDLSPYFNLEVISISGMNEHLRMVDISGLNKLTNLTLSNNFLTKIEGAKDSFPALKYCNIGSNNLDYTSFPTPNPNVLKNFSYKQYGFEIPESKIKGPRIDLFYLDSFSDIDGNEHKTKFTVLKNSIIPEELKLGEDYTYELGYLTLDEKLFKDAEGNEQNIEIIIKMSNDLYPNVEVSSYMGYRSKPITLGLKAAYLLNYDVVGEGKLVVTMGDEVIPTGSKVQEGKQIQVKATPKNDDYKLSKWEINGEEEAATEELTKTFTIESALDIKAFFEEIARFDVTFSATEGGKLEAKIGDQVLESGSQVKEGTVVTFTATPNVPDYVFSAFVVNDDKTEIAKEDWEKVYTKDVTITSATVVKAEFTSTVGIDRAQANRVSVKVAGETLLIQGLNQATEVAILSMDGAMVKTSWVENELSIAELPSGSYIVKINGAAYKIIK